jgi:hypothetical protein
MGRTPSKRIDLGLAILSTRPRKPRTLEEIAALLDDRDQDATTSP